jgi:hypothetical protein
MSRLTYIILTLAITSISAGTQITRIEPDYLIPAKANEITIHGTDLGNLGETIGLWTSFPAKTEILETVPKKKIEPKGGKKEEKGSPVQRKQFKVRISLPTDSTASIGSMRVVSLQGVSDPFNVVIDDLHGIQSNRQNHTLKTAQVVKPPLAVQARSDGDKENLYRLDVQKGQTISVEVLGQRIGSDFDSVLRLLDAEGKELIYRDDDESFGEDSRFSHTFSAGGTFFMGVKDLLNRSNLEYRLRVGDFPLVSTPWPLGAKTGSAAKFQVTVEFTAAPQASVGAYDQLHLEVKTKIRNKDIAAKSRGLKLNVTKE